MAFDGITIAAMVQELHRNLDGGRFNKIAQPESDALMITGKGANCQCFSSSDLFYWQKQTKPAHRAELLYASPQAYRQCPHQQYPPAWHGTCCGI